MRKNFVALVFKILVSLLIVLFSTEGLNAQLCQGSLGDPIVNKTFGAGANPGAPLAAATTSYNYVSGDCPGDGFYTVRSNTNACFGDTWHTLTRDHTGDPNGYFMLVNASLQPSAFYIDTVRGLCSGTTFEFAAWVINVLKSGSCSPNAIQPNLTFTIEGTDGTVLQTYNTNNIPADGSPTWKQYGFFFTTPVGVSSIVLRIFNNSQGGCGNDLALDDITFRPCGPQLTPSISGFPTTDAALCEGSASSFTFNCTVSAGFTNPSVLWQESVNGGPWTDLVAETNTTLVRNFPATTPTGVYSYRLAAAEAGNFSSIPCRVVSPVITITVNPNPVTTTSSNAPICANANLQMTATGGTQYDWTGPNAFTATGETINIANAQTAQSGKYYVTVTSAVGCPHLDSAIVQVNPTPVATTNINETTICEGESIHLIAAGGSGYLWFPATGLSSGVIEAPDAAPLDTIRYQVAVSNQFSCADTAETIVNVIAKPTVNAGPDRSIIKGTSIILPATTTGQNLSYTWTPDVFMDDPTLLQPTVTPPRDTTYVITVTSADGCGTASDVIKVLVYKDIFVPTAFSPNGNGINDTWSIPALAAYPEYDISVFNRQGQRVYFSKNEMKPWNGKFKGVDLPVGVYVYMINVRQGGGTLKGTITLIR